MGPFEVGVLPADHQSLCYTKPKCLSIHIHHSLYPTSWDIHCPLTCRLSGWLSHSSPACASSPSEPKRLSSGKLNCSRGLTQDWGTGTLFLSNPFAVPCFSSRGRAASFWLVRPESPLRAYEQGRQGCLGRQAGRLHSGLGRPKGSGSLYSQASLLSKLDRAMAKACSAHSG